MPRALPTLLLTSLLVLPAAAIPFYWQPRGAEPAFTIDVPAKWNQTSRADEKIAVVHFERPDNAGRVAIEIKAYRTEKIDIEQLLLQLRSQLAVRYDRLFLAGRKAVPFRQNVERQLWNARVGKQDYALLTSFVVAEDTVLQLVCVAPLQRKKVYEYVFDNALLSLNFSQGKPEAAGPAGQASRPAAQAAPGPGTDRPQ